MKLADRGRPVHRAGAETEVVSLLPAQNSTVTKKDADPTCMFVREATRHFRIRPNVDALQEVLYVRSSDAFRRELRRQHLPIEQSDRDQVGKRVIRLLLCANQLLVAFFAPSDDVVGDIEDGYFNVVHVLRLDRMLLAQFQHRLKRRLGVKFGVVTLDRGLRHLLQVLARPIDLEPARNRIHETLVALEDLRRTSDAMARQHGRVHSPEGGVGIGETLPVGERAGPGHAQGVEGGTGDRDRVRRLNSSQAECPGGPCGGGICALRDVVESAGPNWRHV